MVIEKINIFQSIFKNIQESMKAVNIQEPEENQFLCLVSEAESTHASFHTNQDSVEETLDLVVGVMQLCKFPS